MGYAASLSVMLFLVTFVLVAIQCVFSRRPTDKGIFMPIITNVRKIARQELPWLVYSLAALWLLLISAFLLYNRHGDR